MAAPVVNINTVGAFGLVEIDDADSTTGWSGFRHTGGGTPTPQNEQDIFLEGTAAVSVKVSGTNRNEGAWFDNSSGIDMTVAGRHLYIWVAVTTPSLMLTIALGGLYIIVASDASGNNWNKYYVGGSNVTVDARFVRYVIDLNKDPSATAATAATLTSIRWFGAGIQSTGTVKSENLVVDVMHYGDGLQIEAGDSTDPANWEALFQADDAAKYGIIEKRSGVYYLKGGITIGDPAGTVTTLWDDAVGSQVVWENPQFNPGFGNPSTAVDELNLYKLEIVGNSTGTTDVDFGDVVGSGDTRQGILGGSIASDGPKWVFDCETDIADVDTVNLYGMTISGGCRVSLSSSTKTDCIGCTFIDCDEIQPNTAEFLNATIIAPLPDRGLELVASHNVKNVVFVGGTTDDQPATFAWRVRESTPIFGPQTGSFNDAATGDTAVFFGTPNADDYGAYGYKGKFGKLRIDVGTARVGGTIAWQYSTSSGWTTLSGLTDGTNGMTTTGLNDITYDIPTDWEAISLTGESPTFYLRMVALTDTTTNPIIDQGFIADLIEHHLHVPATGTYVISGLNFFGFGAAGAHKWMGENSSAGLVTLQASNATDPIAENEIENTGGGSIAVENTVVLTVNVSDSDGVAIVAARVAIYTDPGGTQLMNEDTAAGGVATENFDYTADQDIDIRVRESPNTASGRYVPFFTKGEITTDGFTLDVILQDDTIAQVT